MIRQIQIGDYADITYDNDKTYRYYIVKIDINKGITIAQFDDILETLLLIKNDDSFKIEGYINPHEINFIRNGTETKYFGRNISLAPEKIVSIAQSQSVDSWTELKNGIILYELPYTSSWGFFDPHTTKIFLYTQFDYPTDNIGRPKILNLDGEIFFYTSNIINDIMKLNLNDFSITVYDSNPHYAYIVPLKDKKILCVLENQHAYILDATTKAKIHIDLTTIYPNYIKTDFYQLSGGDIILVSSNDDTEIHRININDGSVMKIAIFKDIIFIISILRDDKVLLYDVEAEVIQIWDINNNQFNNIFAIRYGSDLIAKHPVGILLQNGDVLFHFGAAFYLFDHDNQTIIKLPLFVNKNAKNFRCSYAHFKQLQNGNLIIESDGNLSIMEFPLSQREIDKQSYDSVKSSIKDLGPDIKKLIRGYL